MREKQKEMFIAILIPLVIGISVITFIMVMESSRNDPFKNGITNWSNK
jgi:uncharacterized membrane protein (GlpM family)